MTKGYVDPFGQVVSEVNGTKVKNLAHLVELIRSNTDEYLTFRFAEDYSETMVFRRKAMLEATEPLMSENGIRAGEATTCWRSGKANPPRRSEPERGRLTKKGTRRVVLLPGESDATEHLPLRRSASHPE